VSRESEIEQSQRASVAGRFYSSSERLLLRMLMLLALQYLLAVKLSDE